MRIAAETGRRLFAGSSAMRVDVRLVLFCVERSAHGINRNRQYGLSGQRVGTLTPPTQKTRIENNPAFQNHYFDATEKAPE
jgi:hypothetical protein